jgi:hypothetical protein
VPLAASRHCQLNLTRHQSSYPILQLPPPVLQINLLSASFVSGNHYGTPKPPKEAQTSLIRATSDAASSSATSAVSFFPGAHPSSEGKRKRNRSNVEAMTAKHFQNDNDEDSGGGGSIEKDPDGASSSATERTGGGGPGVANNGVGEQTNGECNFNLCNGLICTVLIMPFSPFL